MLFEHSLHHHQPMLPFLNEDKTQRVFHTPSWVYTMRLPLSFPPFAMMFLHQFVTICLVTPAQLRKSHQQFHLGLRVQSAQRAETHRPVWSKTEIWLLFFRFAFACLETRMTCVVWTSWHNTGPLDRKIDTEFAQFAKMSDQWCSVACSSMVEERWDSFSFHLPSMCTWNRVTCHFVLSNASDQDPNRCRDIVALKEMLSVWRFDVESKCAHSIFFSNRLSVEFALCCWLS